MEHKYIVWGKIHGSDTLIKLYPTKSRKKAVAWMKRNKEFYDDMRIYIKQ